MARKRDFDDEFERHEREALEEMRLRATRPRFRPYRPRAADPLVLQQFKTLHQVRRAEELGECSYREINQAEREAFRRLMRYLQSLPHPDEERG